MKRKFNPGQHRRAHTKSRNGCLVCKKRKVKCTEERPTCTACLQRNTLCSYPDERTAGNPTSSIFSSAFHSTPLVSLPTRRLLPFPATPELPSDLNLTDLRLQHHFLTTCYPHLPANNESIWRTEIPIIASQRPYLMHSLLGLAATHLDLLRQHTKDGSTQEADSALSFHKSAEKAIHHRTHALAGLHGALQAPTSPLNASGDNESTTDDRIGTWTKTYIDAMLACAYALTFQATYMAHGLEEFVTMVRGCALITRQIAEMGYQSSFALEPNAHVDVFEEHWEKEGMPAAIERTWIERGLEALRKVRTWMDQATLLGRDGKISVEGRFLMAVEEAMAATGRGVRDGYIAFCAAYSVWYDCDAKGFERLTNRTNEASRVLMAFFLALELLFAPVFRVRYESEKRRRDVIGLRVLCAGEWLEMIEKELQVETRMLVKWPREIGSVVVEAARAWVVNGATEEVFLSAPVWLMGGNMRQDVARRVSTGDRR
jgi:hypothetical protein